LIVGITVVVVRLQSQAAHDGPLQIPNAHGWTHVTRVGARFTDGLETLEFTTQQPVTITSVRSIGGEPGLRQVGAYVRRVRRGGIAMSDRHFPPLNPQMGGGREAAGSTLVTLQGEKSINSWQLVLGYELSQPGRWRREAVEINYSVGGTSYRAQFPAEIAVCSSGVRCSETED
jgi:hypothetical protein